MPTPEFRSIHCKARFAFPDQKIDLSAGELMALDHGIHHDVEALEESAFLITISWPGGTTGGRHSR
jgi:quercetin dioxygenase-like cupin family protein